MQGSVLFTTGRILWYTLSAALIQSGNREEVVLMETILIDLLVAVGANVLSYYICKWLDNRK